MINDFDKENGFYPPAEERINIWSHGIGIILSVIGLFLMYAKEWTQGENAEYFAITIYGFSLIILYCASTLYHSTNNLQRRRKLRIIDHAAIYILIAGSYTPYCLIAFPDKRGLFLFIALWTMALIGIVVKLFFTGKFDRLSTILYVAMGWSALFEYDLLLNALSLEALAWLVLGGVLYTIGAILYSIDKLKFNHAIFHLFVLAASFSQFISVYLYVL